MRSITPLTTAALALAPVATTTAAAEEGPRVQRASDAPQGDGVAVDFGLGGSVLGGEGMVGLELWVRGHIGLLQLGLGVQAGTGAAFGHAGVAALIGASDDLDANLRWDLGLELGYEHLAGYWDDPGRDTVHLAVRGGLDYLFGPNDGDARAFVGLSPWFSVRPDVEPAVGLTLRFGIATY